MAKKKSQKRKNNSKILLYIAWILALIASILSALVAGYYFGFINTTEKTPQTPEVHEQCISKKEKLPKSVNYRLKEVLKKEVKQKFISASHEFDYKESAKIPRPLPRPIQVSTNKPKLAIIIDDVATRAHVKAINSLHLVLTKSFLPPRAARPNTPELARHEKFYMVHLPLEASSYRAEEPKTLRVTDSEEKIYKRIGEIKKLFPAVAFVNNHTGSKFTANELAMNRLIYVLHKHGINFIDSRTIATTKAPKVLKSMGLPYVSRDVFLDHHMDKNYVKKQIKKAIQFAKTHKTAIAIGHPHPNTLQALRESKELLKEVELVYVEAVY
jgi:uncharacterized protein